MWTTSYGTTIVYDDYTAMAAAGNPNRWGGWCVTLDQTEYTSKRMTQVLDGSALLVEDRYSRLLWGFAIATYYNKYYNTDKNNHKSPAWRHPGLRSNFLIKDGSVQTYRYTGQYAFDFNWIPVQ
jgi:hypothetical protein